METNRKNFVGYEYKDLDVESKKSSLYIDGFQTFGWELDDNQPPCTERGTVKIRLKRDRKVVNKTELTRLQRNFEDCMDQIEKLERSKYLRANIAAMVIGAVGTMFMAGSTFAVVAAPPILWLCVLLAVPGFAGWVAPYFVYRMMVRKRTKIVNPLIEDKYDEIYEICEKGNHLLGN